MLLAPHPLDPNLIDFRLDHEHYIYGDDYGDIAAMVDAQDYWFFAQWRWQVKFDKHGKKPYLYRKVCEWAGGVRVVSRSVFLHVAIKERADPVRPAGHSMVDHEDGNTLHCRKFNLSYATPSMNRRNIQGQKSMRL